MAVLTQTAANVVASAGYSRTRGIAGEAGITAGMPVYSDTATGKYMKSDASAAGTAKCSGIALNGAGLNQPIEICTSGQINLGGTLVVGETYVVSEGTAGTIMVASDISIGEYPIILGVALSTSILLLNITVGSAARA